MLMELGVKAVENAILASDDARARREDAVDTFEHKRCKMCGNVCHAKLTTCTSCCLPLVSPESYEAASLPRVGDAATYESDSDSEDEEEARFGEDAIASSTRGEDDDGDASERSGPWWARHFTREALETPTLAAGLDPALRSSFAALDVAPGASEIDVRKAYRQAVARAHPDAGGSAKELRAIQRAYDAISLDFWRHDEGAARLRERVDAFAKTGRALVVSPEIQRNCVVRALNRPKFFRGSTGVGMRARDGLSVRLAHIDLRRAGSDVERRETRSKRRI